MSFLNEYQKEKLQLIKMRNAQKIVEKEQVTGKNQISEYLKCETAKDEVSSLWDPLCLPPGASQICFFVVLLKGYWNEWVSDFQA